MASIILRGKKWQYRISWHDSHGKTHSKSKSGYRTKREASYAASQLEVALGLQSSQLNRDIPIADYFHNWYTVYRTGRSLHTMEAYHWAEKELRLFFDNTPISNVTAFTWQQFLNKLGERNRKSTVRHLIGSIKAMTKYAMNERTIDRDFMFGAVFSGGESKPEQSKYLELTQFKKLVRAARKQGSLSSLGAQSVYISSQTGMRVGEVLGLRWRDIVWSENTINVNHSWDSYTHSLGTTKTKTSVRRIEVAPKVITSLRRLRREQTSWLADHKYENPDGYVFFTKRGTVLSYMGARRAVIALQDMIGIPEYSQISFHGLRHTHTSFLIANGIDIYYVSKRLGHANANITMAIYSHLLEDHRTEEAQAAVSALNAIG